MHKQPGQSHFRKNGDQQQSRHYEKVNKLRQMYLLYNSLRVLYSPHDCQSFTVYRRKCFLEMSTYLVVADTACDICYVQLEVTLIIMYNALSISQVYLFKLPACKDLRCSAAQLSMILVLTIVAVQYLCQNVSHALYTAWVEPDDIHCVFCRGDGNVLAA